MLTRIIASLTASSPTPLQRAGLAVAITCLAVVLYSVIALSVARQERHECLVWQAQADGIPAIQYAPHQHAQCDTYNISI